MLTHIPALNDWIETIKELCTPDRVHLVTGSEEEARLIEEELIKSKTFIPLNPEKRPNSFLARSSPEDVARVEDRTFICSEKAEDAGPTNHWKDPQEMKEKLNGLFSGCMKGRTMYVVPFCMGPLDSRHSRIGVQITDSAYVVASLRIMTRMGKNALTRLDPETFVRCVHSVGVPLEANEKDVPWPCKTEDLYIAHFPETKQVWSFGSALETQ